MGRTRLPILLGATALTAGFAVGGRVLLTRQAAIARRRIGKPLGEDSLDADRIWRRSLDGEPIELLVLGDSLAAGLGAARRKETLGGRIAKGLAVRLHRPVRLRTAAVVGSESPDLDAQLDGLAAGYRPDVAVIVVGKRRDASSSGRDIGAASRCGRPAAAGAGRGGGGGHLSRSGIAATGAAAAASDRVEPVAAARGRADGCRAPRRRRARRPAPIGRSDVLRRAGADVQPRPIPSQRPRLPPDGRGPVAGGLPRSAAVGQDASSLGVALNEAALPVGCRGLSARSAPAPGTQQDRSSAHADDHDGGTDERRQHGERVHEHQAPERADDLQCAGKRRAAPSCRKAAAFAIR